MVKTYRNPQDLMNHDNKKEVKTYAKATRAVSSSVLRTRSPYQTVLDRLKLNEENWKNMFQEQQNNITKWLDSITRTVDVVSKTLVSPLVVTVGDPTQED